MDKIWDRKSYEVGGRGGDEKTEWPRRADKKSNAKKIQIELQVSATDLHMYRQCLMIGSIKCLKSQIPNWIENDISSYYTTWPRLLCFRLLDR